MILPSYLETVRNDLLTRVQGGDILINNSVAVPIQAVTIASNPIAGIQNGIALEVTAPHVTGIPAVTNVKLRTKAGSVIAEKTGMIEMNGAQFLSITFAIEVKGGL
ncbi:hypothetical protein [Brevibacillus centrosporus]|uniref:hypothetical protein n=1 Tax=Brevibacillus centrosporus TaxID=54910 RepID=UPI002E1E9576|nr:hypothetical protein [Brevibacillus centrosporus]